MRLNGVRFIPERYALFSFLFLSFSSRLDSLWEPLFCPHAWVSESCWVHTVGKKKKKKGISFQSVSGCQGTRQYISYWEGGCWRKRPFSGIYGGGHTEVSEALPGWVWEGWERREDCVWALLTSSKKWLCLNFVICYLVESNIPFRFKVKNTITWTRISRPTYKKRKEHSDYLFKAYLYLKFIVRDKKSMKI